MLRSGGEKQAVQMNASGTTPIDDIEKQEEEYTGPTGWICPVCGAGISPFVTKCQCIFGYTLDRPKTRGDIKITWK